MGDLGGAGACNLKCTGCWAAEYGHLLNLSFEDMDRVITQGKELGIYLYMLTGGEPLEKKKILSGYVRSTMTANSMHLRMERL